MLKVGEAVIVTEEELRTLDSLLGFLVGGHHAGVVGCYKAMATVGPEYHMMIEEVRRTARKFDPEED